MKKFVKLLVEARKPKAHLLFFCNAASKVSVKLFPVNTSSCSRARDELGPLKEKLYLCESAHVNIKFI